MRGAAHALDAAAVERATALARRAAAKERAAFERDQLKARLMSEQAHDLTSKLDKCGLPFRLVCVNCGTTKTVETHCMRRWCPACAYQVQRERLTRWESLACQFRWPLFITLTMRNTGDPECVRTIRDAWGRMRRRKLMQDRVSGGIATIEVTNTGNGWHPHLHIIANCEWLAIHTPPPRPRDSEAVKRQKYDHARLELSALWAQVIKQETATVLAIRKAPGDALRYAAKYAVKGSDLIACPDPIAPLLRVLDRSRLLSAFGSMHGKLSAHDELPQPLAECPCCHQTKTLTPDAAWLYRTDTK